MIQLYSPGNADYTQNGNITLLPSMANIHAILNGAWSAELSHPIDDEGRWKYIQEEAVIKMPSFLPDDQLFRIKKATKSDSGVVAEMEPIFYDSMGDCWLEDIRPTGDTGQEALNLMLSPNSKYSGSSNISKAATAYYQNVNFMEALNGDIQQSFINRWGGEILFNNYTVIVDTEIGGDYGVELRYGKNIPENGMSEEVDTRDVVTRIYPKGYNGVMMSNNGHVDSPLINNYPTVKSATITFDNIKMAADAQDGDEEDGAIICNSQSELDSQLTLACQQQFESGIDKPKVTISVDMVLLQNTEQYSEFRILESVSLGDTIHCINNHLDIITDARVKELEYDSISKKVSSVVIGDFEPGYFDGVTSNVNKIEAVVRPDGSLMAEKIQGILNGIWTQLRIQSSAAEKVEGRAFLVEDTDEDSELYGAMCWGTQGLQIASQRTADGRDWDWTTAVTAQGIVANTIITGILSDKTGRNYWNLDTGEFRLSADAFQIDDQTAEDYINGEIDNKIAQIRSLTVQLSNEFCAVPTDANGENGNYSECYTDVKVYIGTTDITESEAVTYTVNPSDGVVGSWDAENHRYTVTDMTTDSGNVVFSVTYSGLTMSKQFSIAKIKQSDSQNYTWIKYADTPTSGMSDDPTGKTYLGIAYNKTTLTESTDYSDYEWSLIKGRDGVQGPPGENGETLYTWIKYADTENGEGMSDLPDSDNPKKYIGIAYNKTTPTESDDPDDYTWSLFRGKDGINGADGEPGRTYFLSVNPIVVSQATDGTYNPSIISVGSFYRDGDSAERTAYNGTLIFEESENGSSFTKTGEYNFSQYGYAIQGEQIKAVRITMCVLNDPDSVLDMQTVTIVRDQDNLTQEEIFNILTNNGQTQGIYMQDGKLYLNASYIGSGAITIQTPDGDRTFYANTETGEVSINATSFSLKGKTIDQYISDEMGNLVSNNLLKDTQDFTSTYWSISGSISRNLEAPDGTMTMASLRATRSDSYLSASATNNKPLIGKGSYAFSVWLRATKSMSIYLSLNHVEGTMQMVDVTTDWQCFTLHADVTTITDQNQVTIGGWGSFSSSNTATLYVWNPTVTISYSQEDLFNALTDNGNMQGIFMEGNQLYVNASYIRSGTLVLGGSGNSYGSLQIRNSSGSTIGTWDSNGITAENANITGVINGTSGHIGNWTFTENGITSNVRFNELSGGDSGLIEQSTKVKYQVQLLKYGVTESDGFVAMIIRTRAGNSSSSFLQRFALKYDGSMVIGTPSSDNIQITTDGILQFRNGTSVRGYIEMSNSNTLTIHATNINLDGNVIEPLQ